MKTTTHTIPLPRRTVFLTIKEETLRVRITIRADKTGDFDDHEQFWDAVKSYLHHYDNDPRPLIVDAPHRGFVATIKGDGSEMMVEPGPPPNWN